MDTIKSYSGLIAIPTFEARLEYLRTSSLVGSDTFGSKRYLNQWFYHNSPEWRALRSKVIVRDDGCDLAMPGYPIHGPIFIHHIDPISEEDILEKTSKLLSLDNVVCVSFETHNAIHYGSSSMIPPITAERSPNDTTLW